MYFDDTYPFFPLRLIWYHPSTFPIISTLSFLDKLSISSLDVVGSFLTINPSAFTYPDLFMFVIFSFWVCSSLEVVCCFCSSFLVDISCVFSSVICCCGSLTFSSLVVVFNNPILTQPISLSFSTLHQSFSTSITFISPLIVALVLEFTSGNAFIIVSFSSTYFSSSFISVVVSTVFVVGSTSTCCKSWVASILVSVVVSAESSAVLFSEVVSAGVSFWLWVFFLSSSTLTRVSLTYPVIVSPFIFVFILYQPFSCSNISTSLFLSNCSNIVEFVFGSFLSLTVSEFIFPVVASTFMLNIPIIVIISTIIANSLTFIFYPFLEVQTDLFIFYSLCIKVYT